MTLLDKVKAVGGVVHSDGNIFFTNEIKLQALIDQELAQYQAAIVEKDKALQRRMIEEPDVVWEQVFTTPQPAPDTVPLEKYNKLLDALRDQVGAKDRAGWLGEIDDMLYSILDDETYAKVSREINKAKAEGLQAIADAEGK